MTCAREGCSKPVGKNGIGCHTDFTERVPGFLARALFAARDTYTKNWLQRQVRHAIRGEDWTA